MTVVLVVLAAVTLAVLGFATFAIVKLLAASERTADARVNDTEKAGRIAVLEADLKTQTARADNEERRADALDHELDQVAADGDAAGARERVLARWRRQAGSDPVPAGSGGSGPVPQDGTAAPAVDRDALDAVQWRELSDGNDHALSVSGA